MKYEIEFWLDEHGNALFPAINFVGNAVSRYMPAGASKKASWSEWKDAVQNGKHKLASHAVNALAHSPERTVANIFNIESSMDYESIKHKTYHESEFIYDS